MRIATLVPLVALLAGAAAAPVHADGLAPRDPFWSLRCGLFGWRCPTRPDTPPQPQPTTPQPTTEAPQPTTEAPPATTDTPPETTDAPPETATPSTPAPSPSVQPTQTAPGPNPSDACLTPEFCPDTGNGQGGNPPDGIGSITYPNGTKVTRRGEDGNEVEVEVEERATDLTPFLE
ncbi:hypothetical protein CC85DRAFT_302305 [Cutaneotrichosporon oleaginosum]|uniref:Uncharacterized protein n=1 Tax=Cutaneotrichosporon oleaginosum TaxID=879819 RepID=A0A0J0XMW6_9TREE|nr:uncharacterized protein CC85DRAFT_302305 [Cutaneotrichosporon oleaginosum]KLT42445.1 hypothetical protein CC85DRAFT_302305 [Cutaneotrichosporon oleaginosum]TXT06964.1 hypothetical protein COLE_06295 [Cutaneotrichosporon oleaginosum]